MQVSVVIPVYNVLPYLSECLDSVFSQDFASFEVICVNDGSTDGSDTVLEQYRQAHPNLSILNQRNAGQSVARNAGLARAKGEYVFFLDSDDYLLPGALKKMYTFAAGEDLEMACFNADIGDGTFYFRPGFDLPVSSGAVFAKNFYDRDGTFFGTPVWLYLYRRSFLERHRLTFVPGRIHEDNEFNFRALYHCTRCALSNFPAVFYRVIRENSIIHQVSARHFEDSLKNFRDLYAFYLHHRLSPVFLEALICMFLSTVRNAREQGYSMKEIDLRLSDLLKLAVLSPFYPRFFFRKRLRKGKP